jgi:hypothetical protein
MYFSTLSFKSYDFGGGGERGLEHKMCVSILSTSVPETITIQIGIQRDIIINVRRYPCKIRDIPVDINKT